MRPVTLGAGYTRDDFMALLFSRPRNFAYAEAVVVKLKSGTILSWTNAQQSFTVPQCDGSMGLRTYLANDVLMSGFKFHITNGSQGQSGDPTTSITVDEMSLTIYPDANPAAPTLVDGVRFLTALRQRAFDGAVIQRDRWFFDAPGGNAVGGAPVFYGLSGAPSVGRTQAVIKVKADPVLLNINMPRNMFQPNCQYTVYSDGCGAVKSVFALNDFVGAAPTLTFIPNTSATAQFTAGEITITSGPAAGQKRTIFKADTTGFWLAFPLFDLPLVNDHFTAHPGCDRQHDGGCVFFGRQAAFRATEFVPGPLFAV